MATSLILATLALGGMAAVTRRRAATREAQAESAFPATGQRLMVNQIAVHADITGTGPDLILIHGASGSTRDFTFALTARLAPHFRVIAFDRPGLGWSEGRDDTLSPAAQAHILRAAAAQLGVQNPLVLGHSYGGSVAMAWALQDPANTAALVIVAGATMPWPGELGLWYRLTASRLGAALLIPLASAFVTTPRAEATIAEIFTPDSAPATYAHSVGVGLTLRRKSLRANNAQVNQLKFHLQAQSAHYPSLTLPVELIHGDTDTIVPHHIHSEPLAKLLPNASLTLLPGAGHMPHHTHTDAVLAAIHRAAKRATLR
ncbi:MAG: alpha/beta hydrolase [Paracoccaceae bacterium]